MWNLEGVVDIDKINKLLCSNPSISFGQFMELAPHLLNNYKENRHQTMLMIEWAILALDEDEKELVFSLVKSLEPWTEFNYVMFRILIKTYKNPELKTPEFKDFFLQQLFIALSSRYLIKVGRELFVTFMSKYTLDCKIFIARMSAVIDMPNSTTLIHSLCTQIIPHASKIWGQNFLTELKTKINANVSAIQMTAIKCLIDIKDSEVSYDAFVPHMNISDSTSREIIFTSLCKIKKTSYFYNMFDFNYIVEYIETGDPSVCIDYMPYFVSHIYYCANTKPEKYCAVCETMVIKLRKLAMRLLCGAGGEERIEIGGFLYHLLVEIIIKNNPKTAYPYKPEYPVKGSPLCVSLDKQNKLYLASEDDILYLGHELLDIDTVVPVVKILTDLEETERLFPKDFFLSFLFGQFTEPNVIFIQEKVDVLIEFLFRVYHKTEVQKMKFFVKWLKFWKNYCHDNRANVVHMNCYLSLRAIINAIKRHDLHFETYHCSLAEIDMNIDHMCTILEDVVENYDEIKTYELVLTGCAEMLIERGQEKIKEGTDNIRNVLSKLETIINCNKRSVTAAVTALYRKFVSIVSPLYIDFFRDYMLEKISSINPIITKQSKLRRGAEHRAIIHSICAEVPKAFKELFVSQTIHGLRSHLMATTTAPETISTSIHCINQIMEDRTLKQYSAAYVFELLQFCLDLRNSNQHFSISNARYLLFRTLAFRILPSVDRRNNLQLSEVFKMYPKLFEITLDMGNSDNLDQNTKILLISLLKNANEVNSLALSNDCDYNILPTCVKMLNRQFNYASHLVLDLIVSVIPVHYVYSSFLFINTFLLKEQDISLQVFYNHLYLLNVLSDKLLSHTERDYCNKCYISWQKMQKSMEHLTEHKMFHSLQKTSLMVDFDNVQRLAVNVNFDKVPKCLTVLSMYLDDNDLSDSIKVTAADILLNRTEKTHACYNDVLMISIKIALTTKSVGYVKDLIIELIYILSTSGKTDFPKEILQLILVPYEKLAEKTKRCTKYIFLYTYLLSCIHNVRISHETKRLILDSFYCAEDDEAATVFPRLHIITKNRVELLLIGLFMVTLSDFEDNYICQTVFNHFDILTLSFQEGISTLLSVPFLKNYLYCPKAVHTFLTQALCLLCSLNTNELKDNKQFIYVTNYFNILLNLFLSE